MGKLLFFTAIVGLILVCTGLWKFLLVLWFPILFILALIAKRY